MYKVFRFSITIALIAIAVASVAQTQVQIQGTVRDTSNHTVENVNISVWKADNSSITETTETDALGEYSLGISTSISEVSQINNNIIVINNGISSHIRFSGWLDQKPQAIIISDITGRIISNIPFTYNRFSKQLEAEWQSKISGIYFAQIVTPTSREVLKFITTNNAIPPAHSHTLRAQEQNIAKQSSMGDAIKYYVELSSDGNEPINFVSKLDSVMAYGGETIYPEHVVMPIIPDYTALVQGQVKLNGQAVGEGFKILLTPQQGNAQELYTDANGTFSTSFTIPPQSFPYNPATLSLEALATPTENSIQTTNAQEEIAITHSTTPFTIDMAVDSASIGLTGNLPSEVQGSVIVDGKTIFTGNWPEQYAFNDIKTIKQSVQAQYQLNKYHHESVDHTATVNVWETHEYNPTLTLIPAEYTANINGEEGASVTITLVNDKAKLTFPSPSNLGKSYSHFSTFHRAADRRFMETSNKEEETLWNYTSNGTDQLQTIERNEIDSILVNLHAQKQGKIDFDTTFYLRENLPAFEENNISFTMQDQMAEYTMRITANENANINITNQETGQQLWNFISNGTDIMPTLEQTQLDSMLVNLYAQLEGGLEKDTTFYIKPNSTNEFITPNLEIYNTTIQGTINIGEQNVGPNFNITITPENQEPINTTTNEQGQYNTQINLPAQNYPYEPIPTNINIAATPTEQSVQTTNTQTNATITNTQPTTIDMIVDSASIALTGYLGAGVSGTITVNGKTIHQGELPENYTYNNIKTIQTENTTQYQLEKYHHETINHTTNINVWDTYEYNPTFNLIPAQYTATINGEEGASVTINLVNDKAELTFPSPSDVGKSRNHDSTFHRAADRRFMETSNKEEETLWNYISNGTDQLTTIERSELDSIQVNLHAELEGKIDYDTTLYLRETMPQYTPNNITFTMQDEEIPQLYGRAFGFIDRNDYLALGNSQIKFLRSTDTLQQYTQIADEYGVYDISNLPTDADGEEYIVRINSTATSPTFLPYETTTTIYEGNNRRDFTDIKPIPQKTDILFSTYNEKDSTALSNVLISYYLCGADGMPRTADDELSLQTTSENGHATLTLPTGQNGYFEAEMTGANADDYFKYSAANFDTKNQILFANDTLARVLFLMVEKEQTIPGTQGLESMTLTDGYEVRQRQGLKSNPWSIRKEPYKLSTALLVNDVYGTVEEKIAQLEKVIHETDSMLYDGRNTIVLTDEVYPGTTVYLSPTNNYYNSYQEVRFRSDPYTQTGQEALDSLGFYANVGDNYTITIENVLSHDYLNGFDVENGQTIITDGETKMGFYSDDPVRKEIFFRLRGRGHPNGVLDNTTRTTENLIDRMEQKTYDAFYNHNTTSYTARHLYTNDE